MTLMVYKDTKMDHVAVSLTDILISVLKTALKTMMMKVQKMELEQQVDTSRMELGSKSLKKK